MRIMFDVAKIILSLATIAIIIKMWHNRREHK